MNEKCWLKICDEHNTERLVVNGYEIVLCGNHMKELEENATSGYSLAKSAKGTHGADWPWRYIT